MVKETRISFSPQDILHMRVICVHCRGEATFPIDRTLRIPQHCPYCSEEWYDSRIGLNHVTKHMLNLINAVHYLTNPDNQCEIPGLAFGVRLEIEGEPGKN